MMDRETAMSTERREYLKKRKSEVLMIKSSRLLIVIILFSMWEITARLGIIDAFIMSSPSRIIETTTELIMTGELFYHMAVTCFETAVGFTLGTVFGTLFAVLLWWSPVLSKICEPFLVILNSLPKIALGPIFIVWLGPTQAAIIAMALAISLIVTILEVHSGFCTTDRDKIKLATSLGASRLQVLKLVVLPANTTAVVNALKVNVGLSWVGVIVGEYLISRAGIGYLIVYGGQVFQLDLVMASVVILGILAAIMYFWVVWFEKKISQKF